MNFVDELIPNAKAAKRLGVTTRTLFRWTTQPELWFPRPVIVNARRYFSATEIEAWQASRKPGAEPYEPPPQTSSAVIISPAPHRKVNTPFIDRENAIDAEES